MMFKLLCAAAMAVSASASPWACGDEGIQCCNETDCNGGDLVCDEAGTSNSVCVERTLSHCGECCGEDDCPYGKWCTDENKCEAMCGTEDAECCNGTDCTGRELTCKNPDTTDSVCVKGEACGEKDVECCNGTDCNGNELTCMNDVCVDCGGDWDPPCPGDVCNEGFEPLDGKCMVCGKENKTPCPFNKCRDDLVAIDNGSQTLCIKCGGKGEVGCPNAGCDDDLEEVDGVCTEVSCGEIGELPCEDGCKNNKMSAEAADGICVGGCGDPYWVCCDGPSRCKRDTLTCVDQEGTDPDGNPFWQACTECGGEGEPVCEERDAGCDDDLEDVDGVCTEVSCGEIGELPCEDGCKNSKMSAEAAGGICVGGCGDPYWVCCDGPSRCKRDTLTCVDKEGTDPDGNPFWQACEECGGEGEPVCEEPGASECESDLWARNGICMLD